MMRFADMRAANEDRTKKGNLRKNAKALLDSAAAQHIPPATPFRPVTGLDEHGQAAGDRQGNTFAMHYRTSVTTRETRRANRFGTYGIKPMRSRIQRATRKTRTGGVK